MSIFGAEMEIGETSLYLASVGGRLDVVRFLIEQGTDSNGWTLLHAASHSGHLGVVKLLLRRGVDVGLGFDLTVRVRDVTMPPSQQERLLELEKLNRELISEKQTLVAKVHSLCIPWKRKLALPHVTRKQLLERSLPFELSTTRC
ncbi:hypothetical protein F5888DRAFT_1906536 [Russula emetica]|nr:hypothetical protein F5888DRAFT_1906536 [Russula emetica]